MHLCLGDTGRVASRELLLESSVGLGHSLQSRRLRGFVHPTVAGLQPPRHSLQVSSRLVQRGCGACPMLRFQPDLEPVW